MKKQLNSTTRGFTMIETLVAIAILMISIAGPLTIAQKGLTASVYARDQVTASFLAQDVMEYIKNERDHNIKAGLAWNAGFDVCTSANPCVVDTYNGAIANSSVFVLYHDGAGYLPTGTTPSQFSRRFYMTPMAGTTDEAKATSEVSWRNGTVTNVVTLENQLFNVRR